MKIIFAPDSFKDSLTAVQVAKILKNKAEEIFRHCEMQEIPLANGDAGTIDTLISVLGGCFVSMFVQNYMGETVEVTYGVLNKDTVVIETGQLLRDIEISAYSARQKLLFSSTFGVGEMIGNLLDLGYSKIYVGAGVGMTNDGGMGCASALGVRFYNKKGELLKPAGINLAEISRIDIEDIDPRIRETEITVMCAVNNVLLGESGTTYVYGAYNGGGPDELIHLEHGMRNYAQILEKSTGVTVSGIIGAGSAGGLPVALKAFCGARLQSGIATVLHLIRFEELVGDANLVVVGEGMLDRTSIYGKAMTGIGMMCKAKGIPVVAIVGKIGRDADLLYNFGISSVISSIDTIMEEAEAIENANLLVEAAAEKMFRFIAVGMQIQSKEDVISSGGVEMPQKVLQKGVINWAVDPNWEE